MPNYKYSIRYFLILVLLLNGSGLAKAQTRASCSKVLSEAEKKYRSHNYEESIALIKLCLETGIPTSDERVQAHKQLSKIYFTKALPDSAKVNILILRKLSPNWRPDSVKDTPLFRNFAETVIKETELEGKKWREEQMAAEQNPAKDDSALILPTTKAGPPQKKKSSDTLLILPETSVLDWLAINAGVGTNIGGDEDEKNPLLLHARLGLALAEFEFRTVEIINRLSTRENKRRAALPTVAFKIKIPENSVAAGLPGLTGVFRTSVELGNFNADELGDTLTYRRTLDSFLFFLSKRWGPVQLHTGGSYSFLGAHVYNSGDTLIDSSENKGPDFFAALQLQAKPIAMLMITLDSIAEYEKLTGTKPGEPTMKNLLAIDVRAFLLAGFAIDVGVGWRLGKNPVTLAITPKEPERFRIHLGATIGLSLPQVFHELRKPQDH